MICDSQDHQILHEIILIAGRDESDKRKMSQITDLLCRYFVSRNPDELGGDYK